MKRLLFLTSLLILLMFGCRKDFESTQIIENEQELTLLNYNPPIENVISTVSGIVVDKNGQPIEGALITLGMNERTTDELGLFSFNKMSLNKKGTFVKIEKEGFFESGRKFFPRVDQSTEVKVELLEKQFTQTFPSTSGGTINIDGDGGTILFQPNSIRNSSGEIYSGEVQIATTWLDPTTQSTLHQMPGALQGLNVLNEEVGLTTYGMVGVELQSPSGEALNIADGFTAELSVNLPAELQANAPSEIPLWSFDYTYGIWVEEGSAILQNGKYVGEVSHFSFWNCDYPFKIVDFEMTVIDEEKGIGLSNMVVSMELVGGTSSGTGITNSQGFLSGLIPSGESFILTISDVCENVLYTETIGPFTTDVDLGTYEINSPTIEITGQLLDCNNELVTNGSVVVKMDGKYFSQFVNSNPFTITLADCSGGNAIEIAGGDLDGGEQGEFVAFNPSSSINVGDLAACGELLTGFIKLTVDGTTRFFPLEINQAPDTTDAFITFLRSWNLLQVPAGDTARIAMGFISHNSAEGGFEAGDYSDDHNYVDYIWDTQNEWFIVNDSPRFSSFTVTEYGLYNNTIVEGYMSGTMNNGYGGANETVFVEGEFRAIRFND